MPDLPLSGRSIVITRPIDQAQALAEMIRQAGGTPVMFPLLAITPLENEHPLHIAQQANWAIFISTNAVQHGMPVLLKRFPDKIERLRYAAIGPTTAAELGRYGITDVLVPQQRFDSESLLEMPEMQATKGQHILIFRGIGGRELLAEQLQTRGAEVQFIECYRRINPQQNAGVLASLWQNKQLHAIVVTSSEALRNLLVLADDADWLRQTPLYVNHPRIGELANAHSLTAIIAEMPGDAGMLNSLIRNRTQP